MRVVQSKLNECVAKGSMQSFERLSNALNTEPDETDMNDKDDIAESADTTPSALNLKGENKVPARKQSRKQKHKLQKKLEKKQKKAMEAAAAKMETDEQPKKRPKYWCAF